MLSPTVRRVIETRQGIAIVRYGAPSALVALLWLWHTTSLYSTNLFGGVTAVPTQLLTAFVVLAVTAAGPAAAVLGSLPLRTIGKISFAAYLLHWPLFLLIDGERLDLPSPPLFLVRLAATLLPPPRPTYALERPLRDKIPLPRPQLAAGARPRGGGGGRGRVRAARAAAARRQPHDRRRQRCRRPRRGRPPGR